MSNRTETISEDGVKTIIYGDAVYILNPLTMELKEKAVEILKNAYPPETFEEIRNLYKEYGDEWASKAGIHMFFGMGVRNNLRQGGLKDDLLPKNTWNGQDGMQNWDDTYIFVLEIAAGIKDINEYW
jgi:hypothetical protein